MKNNDTILTDKSNNAWKNFQRNLIPVPTCDGCDRHCIVLYDSHHDEYFSATCGLVVMQNKCYLIDYKPIVFKRRRGKRKKKV